MNTGETPPTQRKTAGQQQLRWILTAAIGWVSMLGTDIVIHAGFLARFYVEPAPFLLPPAEAFRRIPLGYLSFFLSALLLLWLMTRLRIQGWRPGLIFGLQFGAFVWGIQTTGLLSITTAQPALLLGWFVGQTLELGIAGAVIGSALSGASLPRLFLKVLAYLIGMVAITILLQNTGFAPAVKPYQNETGLQLNP